MTSHMWRKYQVIITMCGHKRCDEAKDTDIATSFSGLFGHMPLVDESAGADEVLAPMPGLLTRLLVKEGDEVQKGQNVAVIEAMKMENMLVAEANGVVKQIKANEGDNLNVDDLIILLSLSDDNS